MPKFAKMLRIVFVLVFVVIANVAETMASVEEVVQYHLSPANVTHSRVHKWEDELFVQITLDEFETARFAELTKNNVGKTLQVLLDGQVIIEAVVKAEIDSGSMSVRVSDETDAEQLIHALKP